jgi:hypothetical protein
MPIATPTFGSDNIIPTLVAQPVTYEAFELYGSRASPSFLASTGCARTTFQQLTDRLAHPAVIQGSWNPLSASPKVKVNTV